MILKDKELISIFIKAYESLWSNKAITESKK